MEDLLAHLDVRGAVVVALGYAVTLGASGWWVRWVTGREHAPESGPHRREASPSAAAERPGRFDPSTVIGKCENLLAVTFVLAGEVMGLALIFTAKSLVRRNEMEGDPGYYLVGTLVNFTWSVAMGYLTRWALLAAG